MKVLLPSIRKNGTIRIINKGANVVALPVHAGDVSFYQYQYCIPENDIEKMPEDVIFANFDPALISNPKVIFRGNMNIMQYASKIYSVKGEDFILHSGYTEIWESTAVACSDLKEQLKEIFELSDNDFTEFVDIEQAISIFDYFKQLIPNVRYSRVLAGFNVNDNEAISFMIRHPSRFITSKGESIYNKRITGKKMFTKYDYNDILNNPVLIDALRRNKANIITYLDENFNITLGNPYLLKLLYNDAVSYLGSHRALASDYRIDSVDTNFKYYFEYSKMAYKIYTATNYTENVEKTTDELMGEYGLELSNFFMHGSQIVSHMKTIIGIKSKYKGILDNFKVNYDLA